VTRPLLFAYGSNLDAAQMRRRCPTAAFAGRAALRGYRLAFAGYSAAWGGAVATVVPSSGGTVEGALYRISLADRQRLDRHEGVPFAYARIQVNLRDESGRRRRAHAYVLDGRPPGVPSPLYVGVIARAYGRLGFDRRALYAALRGRT
jgi:gamma-glutamylcyclotransferase (GGCT)/AIG2-like uncharacterized protein YtfP